MVLLYDQALYDTSPLPATSSPASCTPAHAAEIDTRPSELRSQNTGGSGAPETVAEFQHLSSEQQHDAPQTVVENNSSAR